MYGWIWRHLPGGRGSKALLSLLLAGTAARAGDRLGQAA